MSLIVLWTTKYNLHYHNITKTRLFKYTENCTTKEWKFSDKNSDILYFFKFLLKTLIVGTR